LRGKGGLCGQRKTKSGCQGRSGLKKKGERKPGKASQEKTECNNPLRKKTKAKKNRGARDL